MAITNFIPTLWSARLLANLDKSLVYGGLVNRDYEGEITGQGSSVKINQIGDITISDYVDATGLSDPESIDGVQQTLTIDQAKSFHFSVTDINKVQANVDLMNGAMQRASYGMADVVDQYIAGFYTGVDSANTIGDDTTPIVPTKDNAYEYLVDLAVKLDEANVPVTGRFVIVPSWYHGLLLKDARFTKDPNILSTGYIGDVDGLRVFKSNNVPNTTGTKYKIMAGSNIAISFAQQLVEVKPYSPEKSFSDAVKGLNVYGCKLVQPKAIAVLTANKA